MSYTFEKDKMYRTADALLDLAWGRDRAQMVVDSNAATIPRGTSIAVSFLTQAAQLEAFLPPGFALDGEPVVTINANYMTRNRMAGRTWLQRTRRIFSGTI